MSKIKFISDFVSGEVTFERNGIWEYIDKYETLLPISCDNDCERFIWIYKVTFENIEYLINGDYVVEIDYVINKDYTKSQWDKFIMKDILVEDGDYVKEWIRATGINKPVKDVTDQCDYNPRWKSLQKQIEKKYGNDSGGFEQS